MDNPTPARIEALKAEWTDQFVRANMSRPELSRFGDIVGRHDGSVACLAAEGGGSRFRVDLPVATAHNPG